MGQDEHKDEPRFLTGDEDLGIENLHHYKKSPRFDTKAQSYDDLLASARVKFPASDSFYAKLCRDVLTRCKANAGHKNDIEEIQKFLTGAHRLIPGIAFEHLFRDICEYCSD